ncbi:MAG: TetR/AcrR family transcriptional regulator [Bacteroidetes bacterium]|nr:TetR/AcrR family transcriptional regulator [Bacteroidota bacterium]
MELSLRITLNEKLYLKNPEESILGRKIVTDGLKLINTLGFEDFTFKKLAQAIETTEATIYRYFENKHRLLVYLVNWYWTYLEYKVMIQLTNITDAKEKIKRIISALVIPASNDFSNQYIGEKEVFDLVMYEGSKSYLTRSVANNNKDQLFKPYKDLCARISLVITEVNPKYKYPHSLASTLVEMSHAQKFFRLNLPSLTDFAKDKNDKSIVAFLEHMVLETLKK